MDYYLLNIMLQWCRCRRPGTGTGHDCSKINGSLALKSSSLPDSASHPILLLLHCTVADPIRSVCNSVLLQSSDGFHHGLLLLVQLCDASNDDDDHQHQHRRLHGCIAPKTAGLRFTVAIHSSQPEPGQSQNILSGQFKYSNWFRPILIE